MGRDVQVLHQLYPLHRLPVRVLELEPLEEQAPVAPVVKRLEPLPVQLPKVRLRERPPHPARHEPAPRGRRREEERRVDDAHAHLAPSRRRERQREPEEVAEVQAVRRLVEPQARRVPEA